MTGNRRRFARQVVNSPVYVSLGSSSGILYNLGEGGLAVDLVGSALGHELIPLGFGLPDSGQHIEGNAQVAWTEAGPRVGLRFVDLPQSSRQQIKTWLSARATTGAPEESVAVQPQQDESLRARSAGDGGLVTDLRSALFQTVELPGAKGRPLIAPEEAARIQQRRRKLILAGISICLVGLAGVAGVAFFRSNRAQFVAEFGEFKKQITGIFGMFDAGSASKSVARPGVAKSPRRHNEAKSQPATSSELAAKTDDPAKPAKPFEIEVVDPEGQRHLVKPRGSTRLRVQFQGPSWARGSVNAPGGGSGVAAAASARSASPSAAPEPRPGAGSISRETSGDVPTQQVMPAYPLLALQKNMQGRVVLQVTVAKDGSVQNVRLLSGHPILATAVVDAVKQWRYKPTYRDGEPVEVDRRITVDFVISTD